jgi:hypothetical protein
MNCASARNRILALADPAVLPQPLLAHVDGCSACRAWHRVVIQVESAVAAVAIPASDGNTKRQLLAKFQAPSPRAVKPKKSTAKSPIIKTPLPVKTSARPANNARQPLGERLARLWPAGLVAAAILVGAISWSIYGGKSKENPVVAAGPDPMLKEVVAAKVKLDTAPNAAARVDVLAKLADTIHEEARTLSKVTPGNEMTSLAKMYDQVIRDGLVPQARALSGEERRAKLPAYAERFAKAEQEANLRAADAPVGSQQPLYDIAETARTARFELTKLIQRSEL